MFFCLADFWGYGEEKWPLTKKSCFNKGITGSKTAVTARNITVYNII